MINDVKLWMGFAIVWFSVAAAFADEPVDVGDRLQLFIDHDLVETLTDARLEVHHPVRQELAVTHDKPWEGSGCGYHTVFKDGDKYRMYYHAWHLGPTGTHRPDVYMAYLESSDGIHWERPNLGIVEYQGSTSNNILIGPGDGWMLHDFSPFKDENPRVSDDARYKAVGLVVGPGWKPLGLHALKSPDAIHWSFYNDRKPVLTGKAFDTQNIAFWDPNIGQYRLYLREFHTEGQSVWRDIMTSTSGDLIHWSEPQWLEYPGAPKEQLYTNQIKPYYRAPHLYVGLPARYTERQPGRSLDLLPSPDLRAQRATAAPRFGQAVTETLLMTSRDGRTFHRWPQAFLRPGLRTQHNWAYGDNYMAWQLVETPSTFDDSPPELSLYATESYFTGNASRLRRYSLRIDGFVSVNANANGGSMRTRPLKFAGDRLTINYATSAAGAIRVEIQDLAGKPIEGFSLADCDEVFGDSLDRVVSWRGREDLGDLAGKPIRLLLQLKDADLYSLRFSTPATK